jgi:hypothetical protein
MNGVNIGSAAQEIKASSEQKGSGDVLAYIGSNLNTMNDRIIFLNRMMCQIQWINGRWN